MYKSQNNLNSTYPETHRLDEITVEHQSTLDLVTGETTGVEVVNLTELDKIPVLFGEIDVVNAQSILQGLKRIGEKALLRIYHEKIFLIG